MRRMLTMMIDRDPSLSLCGTAENGVEALEKLPQGAPDVVLVDMSLPNMSGIELIKRMRQQFPELRSLVVSGHDEAVHAETALQAGARGYVMKGDPPAIIEAIRQVLEGEVYLSDRVRQRLTRGGEPSNGQGA